MEDTLEKEVYTRNTLSNIEKYLSLLWMTCKDYTTFTSFNIANSCRIYKVDERVIDILKELEVVEGSDGDATKYRWVGSAPTPKLALTIHQQLNKAIMENGVGKEKIVRKRISKEDKDYVSSTLHLPVEEVAEKLGRTIPSVKKMRRDARTPQVHNRKTWTEDEHKFIKENDDKTSKWIAKKLGRKESSVYQRMLKLARLDKSYTPNTSSYHQNKLQVAKKPKAKKKATKSFGGRRFRLFWGLLDIQW